MQCKEFVKFGISNDPFSRIRELQTGNPYKIHLLLSVDYEYCQETERTIHKYFDSKRGIGEWFKIDDEITKFVKYMKNIEYNKELCK